MFIGNSVKDDDLALTAQETVNWYIESQKEGARNSKALIGAPGTSEWAGNRPCTPDSLPIIDRVPGEEIFVATGHGHLGLTQGPVTGRLLDQMMAGQPTEIPLAPYGLARFA